MRLVFHTTGEAEVDLEAEKEIVQETNMVAAMWIKPHLLLRLLTRYACSLFIWFIFQFNFLFLVAILWQILILCCFQIYSGKVTTIMQFGCFVQLEGLRGRHEGLVHESEVNSFTTYCTSEVVPFLYYLYFYWSILCWSALLMFTQLCREGQVAKVSDVVHRGQKVMVKVLSMAGSKISLSMKVSAFLYQNQCLANWTWEYTFTPFRDFHDLYQ